MQELEDQEITSILVTHDLADAWQWASRCLVLEEGTLVEDTSPAVIAARPASLLTAALAGFGCVRGAWADGAVAVDGTRLPASAAWRPSPGEAVIGIADPGRVQIVPAGTADAVPGLVDSVALAGGVARIRHSTGLVVSCIPGPGGFPAAGETMWLRPKTLSAYPDLPPGSCRPRGAPVASAPWAG